MASMSTAQGVYLVTGASRGMGKAVAISLARSGANLVLSGRDEAALRETARRCGAAGHAAIPIAGDLCDELIRQQICQAVGERSLRGWFHAASPRPDPDLEASLLNTPADRVAEYLTLIVGATTDLLAGLQPSLEKGRPSNVVLMITDWAKQGSHGPPAFSAAKAALAHLAHTARRDLASHGIRVTSVFAGDVATYDANWERPVWDIDDDIASVEAEFKGERIALQDIVSAVNCILSLRTARVEELWLSPDSSTYDY